MDFLSDSFSYGITLYVLAMPLRAASGALVPLSELVRVDKGVIDKPLYTKDLLALLLMMFPWRNAIRWPVCVL
mgnify:CR=1 FL=1